ncbi:MAG: ATP-NAD kinase-like domain-containing protein [Benjaminiella poitrasii]|nr:MAG: ATP-NAD kinase-like domain-containing protein [Benjaminiella poitrasii]
MVYTLKANKVNHPINLSFDKEGLRIEGDLTAAKQSKTTTTVCCIPVPPGKGPDPTLLPIDNVFIINAFYHARTKMVHFYCVLPEDRTKDDSPADIYKFMYSIDDDKIQEAEIFCDQVLKQAYQDVKFGKRLLVLINPFGGQGKAKETFEYHVRPIFESAKCSLDVKYTEHQGHALQITQDLDVEAYDAVVTVSGDGVIHEVINGFLKRPDAREAMKKVSIGIIPCGTGNSLSISILGEKRGFDPCYTALQVIKGKPMALDLCSIVYDDHRYFSFLSQNYGITAYADLGTEHMRWMGDTRAVVGLMQEIFSRHTYNINAAVQVVESDKKRIQNDYVTSFANETRVSVNELEGEVVDTIPNLSEPVPKDWMVIDDEISFFLASKVPLLSRGMLSHPCALPNDGTIDLLLVRGSPGITKQLDVFTKVETGKHINCDIVKCPICLYIYMCVYVYAVWLIFLSFFLG